MNKKVLDENTHKKEAYRGCKQGDLDRGTVRMARDLVRKVKVLIEINPVRAIQDSKKSFCNVGDKRKTRDNASFCFSCVVDDLSLCLCRITEDPVNLFHIL